jgi:GNAT superfamily N-acetyltransferase
VIVRLATADDIPAVAAVLDASGETSTWPDLPGWPYIEHLVARSRVLVAIDGDEVIGMAGSMTIGRPDVRFLSDLFVHPERQDHGAGRALLAAAFDDSSERMTFSSADPRALAMYIRAGLRPWWPCLYLEVPGDALASGAASDHAFTAEQADPVVTARWSETWTDMDRSADFAHYAGLPEGRGHVIREGDEAAAVVWSNRRRTRPDRAMDHISIAPGADARRAPLAALRAAIESADSIVVTIPGPHPATPWLLDRGARILDRDTYCATDPALLDPERILPNPGFL